MMVFINGSEKRRQSVYNSGQMSLFPEDDVQRVKEVAGVTAMLPPSEQPFARLDFSGAEALSTIELLTLFVGGKRGQAIATRLLVEAGDLRRLTGLSRVELQAFDGVGAKTAARLKAILELGKRIFYATPGEKVQIHSPADVANLLMMEMQLLEKEELRVVLLNTKNVVQDIVTVYVGSLNTAVVRIAEVFRPAIRANSASIIVLHNHPSGDPTPSPEDVRVTEKIVETGQLLNIELLDHLVIGGNRFVSLKERGLGFR